MLAACGLAVSTAAAQPAATTSASAPSLPQTPGFHNLYYHGKLNGQDRRLAYVLYLPKGYDPSRPWPAILYLCGVGERGDNHEGVYGNGPPLALKADKALADWAPFIVLAPQCPGDVRWDSPGMPQLVMDLLGMVRGAWALDADRTYLTGLSMGGAGVWNVALAGKGEFAVVAPFCSIEVAADKMPLAVKGRTVWIIVGGADGGYTEGSRKMRKALADAQVDVVYTEVPGKDHGVWQPFYNSRKFYEFLLMHARGSKSPASRPVDEQLLAISYTPPNSADAQLAEPFKKFLPWWYLSNCGKGNSPGLKDELAGRKNVFVTTPLDVAIPCRMLYTVEIPRDRKTTLDLAVAAHPQGQWELAVRGNGSDLLKQTIGGGEQAPTQPAQTAGTWVQVHVNLAGLSGQDAHLELVNRAPAGAKHPEAYWGKVELASRDLEFDKFLPGWTLTDCGLMDETGLRSDVSGRKNVFVTTPADRLRPCCMTAIVSVSKGRITTLDMVVGHHPQGAWHLIVRGNGMELLRRPIGLPPATEPASEPKTRPVHTTPSASNEAMAVAGQVVWERVSVDLSHFAGQDVKMELLDDSAGPGAPGRWAAYWAQVDVNSHDVPASDALAAQGQRTATIIAAAVVGLAALVLILMGLRAIIRRRVRR